MPSFKASDELTSKPAWLTAAQQTDCHGADAAETGTSGLVMHQGWTVPQGGNDNVLAQRETIACVNMTSDIGAADDDIWAGTGGGGSSAPAMTKMIWNDAPAGYSTDTWGSSQNSGDSSYGELNSSSHNLLNVNAKIGTGFLAQQQYSGGDWYAGGTDGNVEFFANNIWRILDPLTNYRWCGPASSYGNPMPYTLRLYPVTLPANQSIVYPAGITLDLTLQMESWYTGMAEPEPGSGHYHSGWYFTLAESSMDFTQDAWVLHALDPNEVSRWTAILGEWSTSGMMGVSWDWAIDASGIYDMAYGAPGYWFAGP
jgi:hypothetical protein